MKIAVFSDTHGNTSGMIDAARRVQPDVIVHLGDNIRDAMDLSSIFPGVPIYAVPGNCDYMPGGTVPDKLSFMAGPVRVFATHGHNYSVKFGIDALLNAAYYSGASLVLYGHTHIAHYEAADGMCILNPGTAGKGTRPTFAVVEISDDGAIVCRITNIYEETGGI